MEEGNPRRMLDRGEKVELPPALVFGGDKDELVPVELMRYLSPITRRPAASSNCSSTRAPTMAS
jgi:hypothetical protein